MRHGDRNVNVEVVSLLTTMRTNREEHGQIYKEAMKGYQEKCISLLEGRLAAAKAGKVNLQFSLSEPRSHLEEYDLIIQMLEWTTELTVEVSMQEFNAWVRDRWSWQGQFLESNSAYSVSALRKSVSY